VRSGALLADRRSPLTVNQPTQPNLRKTRHRRRRSRGSKQGRAGDHRVDFELERADRLMMGLLQTPTGTVVEADRKACR
jgi:hypothetical protein